MGKKYILLFSLIWCLLFSFIGSIYPWGVEEVETEQTPSSMWGPLKLQKNETRALQVSLKFLAV